MTQPALSEEFTDADLEQYMPQGDGSLDSEIAQQDQSAADAAEEQISESDQGEGADTEAEAPAGTGEGEAEGGAEQGAEGASAPTPDEVTRLREENTRLQRESAERQRQAEEAQIQQAAAQYAQQQINQYVQAGWDEQSARAMGIADARAQVAEYKANQATLRSTRIELSHQFGVPQEQLQGFKDEASMRHYAEQYANTTGPQAKRIERLEKEITDLKKGQVPAQPYNQPSGTRGGSTYEQDLDRYNNGDRDESAVAAARRAAGL